MLSMLAGAAGGGLSSSTSSSASGQSGDIAYNGAFSVGGKGNSTGAGALPPGNNWLPYVLAGAGLLVVLVFVLLLRRK